MLLPRATPSLYEPACAVFPEWEGGWADGGEESAQLSYSSAAGSRDTQCLSHCVLLASHALSLPPLPSPPLRAPKPV